MSDFRSKSLSQVSRIAIGVLLTLASASLAGAYVARCEMETKSREHSQRLQEASQHLVLLRSMLGETSAVVNQSRDRLMQAGFLGFSRSLSGVDGATAEDWRRKASLEGQDAAAKALATLARFANRSSQVAQPLVQLVEEMLRAEIQLWRKSGAAGRQGARPNDEKAALREYRKLDELYANASSTVGGEFHRQGMAGNVERKQSVEEALERSRTRLQWSGLGLATATLGFPCYCLYLYWPRLQTHLPNKTLIVADRPDA